MEPDPRTPFVDSEPPRIEHAPFNPTEDPWQTDVELTADERVRTVLLKEALADREVHTCETTQITSILGNDGYYGCETGCLRPYFEVTLHCEHYLEDLGQEWTYHGGIAETFADFLDEMARA